MSTHYEVNRRNGYTAVDEYDGTRCVRNVYIGAYRPAEAIANAFNEGYARGQADATAREDDSRGVDR